MLASPVREGPGVNIHFPVSAKSDSKCAAQSKQKRQAPYPDSVYVANGRIAGDNCGGSMEYAPKTQMFDSTDEIFSTTYAYELQDLCKYD